MEVMGAILITYLQELGDTSLIGSESSNLLDDAADESSALAELALGAGRLSPEGNLGHLVTLVKSNSKTGSGHYASA